MIIILKKKFPNSRYSAEKKAHASKENGIVLP